MLYEKIIRPILFKNDPEFAHEMSVSLLNFASKFSPIYKTLEKLSRYSYGKPISLFGLDFPNAVGLAAGLDKDAEFIPMSQALGFGHVEVGTVTPIKQPGNPQPRLFRYPESESIINRFGFNNKGADSMLSRLQKLPPKSSRKVPIGINIGKGKATLLEDATQDYLTCFKQLADYGDYFAINISSPNTSGLRSLQGKEYLGELLNSLQAENRARTKKMGNARIPILLKISPDLSFTELDDVLEAILEAEIDGIIATNTTINREGPLSKYTEVGGLSGKLLCNRSDDTIKYVAQVTNGKLPIIGVGGIHNVEAAAKKMDLGASLVQIYSGFIYKGPGFINKLAKGLEPHTKPWF